MQTATQLAKRINEFTTKLFMGAQNQKQAMDEEQLQIALLKEQD